jgi:hypothetical protein
MIGRVKASVNGQSDAERSISGRVMKASDNLDRKMRDCSLGSKYFPAQRSTFTIDLARFIVRRVHRWGKS